MSKQKHSLSKNKNQLGSELVKKSLRVGKWNWDKDPFKITIQYEAILFLITLTLN